MLIKTDQSIIHDREKITNKIASFWDQTSDGWRTVWGPHIHHGYYEDRLITPLQAQEKLIDKLAAMVEIKSNDKILDVGCGMGGSSFYLAKKHHAIMTGITLSQQQVMLASQQAQTEGINNVNFKIEDALSMQSLADNSFDIVWSLESCEQFFDKELFFKQAYRVLKPGGKFILATWCSSCDAYEGKLAKAYRKLCLAFDLPYMPTINYYRTLFTAQHFLLTLSDDWSPYVKKSWDIGVSLLNAYSLLQVLKVGGWRGYRFAKKVKLMQKAFHQDRINYGVFLARKPLDKNKKIK